MKLTFLGVLRLKSNRAGTERREAENGHFPSNLGLSRPELFPTESQNPTQTGMGIETETSILPPRSICAHGRSQTNKVQEQNVSQSLPGKGSEASQVGLVRESLRRWWLRTALGRGGSSVGGMSRWIRMGGS